MKYALLLILGFGISAGLKAQLGTDADFKRQVYDREYTGGIGFHSRGFFINGRYLKYLDGFNKHGLEIDITKLRHPKETHQNFVSATGVRGFVYGRINSFYALRAGYAREKVIFDKTDQGSISIAWNYSGGLSLGLLKPVYVMVPGEVDFQRLEADRYNPEEHDVVYGEANYFMGILNTKLQPGIYAKTGFIFDYDLLDKKVTSIEGGFIFDYYVSKVPIFYYQSGEKDMNLPGFYQLYVTFNFGYKKN